MKKLIFAVFISIFGLSMTSSVFAKKCGEVSISEMNWSSGAVVTAVSKFLMTQGYGCKVKVIPSGTTPAVTSMAENGEPQIVTELWEDLAPLYAKLKKQGKAVTAGKVLSDGGINAWWIPKYLADKYPQLKTIDGVLKNPKLVGGVFNNCPDGWGCRVVSDNLIKAFELEKNGIKIFNHGSGETLAASIASAYKDKKPWFGFYWEPTDLLALYDMVEVDLGPYNKKIHECNGTKDCKTPGKSSFPPASVVTAVTKKFADNNPQIFKLMQNVSFSNKIMKDILLWKNKNKASSDEAAVYFIQNYKDTWSKWISKDAKKKMKKFL